MELYGGIEAVLADNWQRYHRDSDLLLALRSIRQVQRVTQSDVFSERFKSDSWTLAYIAQALLDVNGGGKCEQRPLKYEDFACLAQYAVNWEPSCDNSLQFFQLFNALRI